MTLPSIRIDNDILKTSEITIPKNALENCNMNKPQYQHLCDSPWSRFLLCAFLHHNSFSHLHQHAATVRNFLNNINEAHILRLE